MGHNRDFLSTIGVGMLTNSIPLWSLYKYNNTQNPVLIIKAPKFGVKGVSSILRYVSKPACTLRLEDSGACCVALP